MSGSRMPPNCRHSQSRICENLKFGLQQMKYRGQKDAYKAVVDAIGKAIIYRVAHKGPSINYVGSLRGRGGQPKAHFCLLCLMFLPMKGGRGSKIQKIMPT